MVVEVTVVVVDRRGVEVGGDVVAVGAVVVVVKFGSFLSHAGG